MQWPLAQRRRLRLHCPPTGGDGLCERVASEQVRIPRVCAVYEYMCCLAVLSCERLPRHSYRLSRGSANQTLAMEIMARLPSNQAIQACRQGRNSFGPSLSRVGTQHPYRSGVGEGAAAAFVRCSAPFARRVFPQAGTVPGPAACECFNPRRVSPTETRGEARIEGRAGRKDGDMGRVA